MIEPAALVELINHRHGTHYRLATRDAGGESGAVRVLIDDGGAEYYLKWGDGSEFRHREALTITERLRARGYPVPEYVAVSDAQSPVQYQLQRAMRGRAGAVLTPALVAQVLKLNELQRSAAEGLSADWPALIVESLETGFKDWCVHSSLHGYSPETANLLDDLKRTGDAAAHGEFARDDAVHFDFSPANILVDNDAITGVVDWSGCCPGDRVFDLVTMGFYALEDSTISAPLLDAARQASSRKAIALYLAHMILRQLDWSIRHHSGETVARYIGMARLALPKIRSLRD
jgi:hypothetical protein